MCPSIRPGIRNLPLRSTDTVVRADEGRHSLIAADVNNFPVANGERLSGFVLGVCRENDAIAVYTVGSRRRRRRGTQRGGSRNIAKSRAQTTVLTESRSEWTTSLQHGLR